MDTAPKLLVPSLMCATLSTPDTSDPIWDLGTLATHRHVDAEKDASIS